MRYEIGCVSSAVAVCNRFVPCFAPASCLPGLNQPCPKSLNMLDALAGHELKPSSHRSIDAHPLSVNAAVEAVKRKDFSGVDISPKQASPFVCPPVARPYHHCLRSPATDAFRGASGKFPETCIAGERIQGPAADFGFVDHYIGNANHAVLRHARNFGYNKHLDG
jgi:hypothetical protein